MSILDAVTARLLESPNGRQPANVQGLNALAEILANGGAAVDAMFVIPDGERASGGQSTTGAFEQLVDIGVGVAVMATTGIARSRAGESLEAMKEFAKKQLIGWGCPGGRAPVEFRGATPLPIAPGRVAMLLRFAVPTRVRVTRTGAPDA